MLPRRTDYSPVLFLGSTHLELWRRFEARRVMCWRQWVFRPGGGLAESSEQTSVSGETQTLFQDSFPGAVSLARRNWRVEDWSDAIKSSDRQLEELINGRQFEVIVVILGTQNIHDTEPEVLVEMFLELLGVLHERMPRSRIVLLSVLPRLPQSLKLDKRITTTNSLLKESVLKAADSFARFFDITDCFYHGEDIMKKAFQGDRIQLNLLGYAILRKTIKRILRLYLRPNVSRNSINSA